MTTIRLTIINRIEWLNKLEDSAMSRSFLIVCLTVVAVLLSACSAFVGHINDVVLDKVEFVSPTPPLPSDWPTWAYPEFLQSNLDNFSQMKGMIRIYFSTKTDLVALINSEGPRSFIDMRFCTGEKKYIELGYTMEFGYTVGDIFWHGLHEDAQQIDEPSLARDAYYQDYVRDTLPRGRLQYNFMFPVTGNETGLKLADGPVRINPAYDLLSDSRDLCFTVNLNESLGGYKSSSIRIPSAMIKAVLKKN
jgi:hypothetical protein